MSNNPYSTPEEPLNTNGTPSPYGTNDPAAQYGAQAAYGQQNPAQPAGQDPNLSGGAPQHDPYAQAPAAQQYGTPQYGAPQYGAPQYGQPAGYPANQYAAAPVAQIQGQKDSQTSLIVGIIGLITSLGIILGPIAIYYAKKAEKAGVSATAGKVLGWISVIVSILAIVAFILFVVVLANSPELLEEIENSSY